MDKTKVVKDERVPGTYRAECTCGWSGMLYGAKGARDAARSDMWSHRMDHEDAERGRMVFSG